jgi:hypothetical protein
VRRAGHWGAVFNDLHCICHLERDKMANWCREASRMEISDRKRLNIIAEDMLGEARAVGRDRIYSATGFSRQNISIVHQQIRCTNLAWALRQRRKVRKGDVVAIIGGSFSGIMLSCSLAIANDVIVYILEKESRLFHRFLDKSQRFLSQNLNSRDLRKGFSPSYAAPLDSPAIFEWEAGVASDVAGAWLREFNRYATKLPIFTIHDCEVEPNAISEKDDKVFVQLRAPTDAKLKPLVVDVLIDATGFGPEANPHKLVDYSYWEGGHRLIYDHLPPKSHVLISGCGDSGVIELMHYAIADFQHEMVTYFWPPNAGLEAILDQGLERINSVLRSEEVPRFEGRLISELCWWLDRWWYLQHWQKHHWEEVPQTASTKSIFAAIEAELAGRIAIAFPGRKSAAIPEDQREAFALALSLEDQLAVRAAIGPAIDDALSLEIAALLKPIKVEKLLNLRALRKKLRPGTKIVLNGVTPTPFTRNLSPYNVWLTHVMIGLPNIRYRKGRIVDTNRMPDGQTRVTFSDDTSDDFDRVITRYGPGRGEPDKQLSAGNPRDPYPGDYLLDYPTYSTPTEQPSIWRNIRVGTDRVTARVPVIERRRGTDPNNPIYKPLYIAELLRADPNPWLEDPRYKDPQIWLGRAIRKGCYPAYRDRL